MAYLIWRRRKGDVRHAQMESNTKKLLDMEQGKALELVHVEVCGLTRTPSLSGAWYFMLLVDDFSQKSWVFFLKKEIDALNAIMKFKAKVEEECGRKISVFQFYCGDQVCYVH
jgi:hypothetical protein